jgi:hypothetical protein
VAANITIASSSYGMTFNSPAYITASSQLKTNGNSTMSLKAINVNSGVNFTLSGTGALTLRGDITTVDTGFTLNRPTTLGSNVTITTFTVPDTGNNFSQTGTVNSSSAGLYNYVVNAGTGTASITGAIGTTAPASVSITDSTITINQATLTVTAQSATRLYGAPDPNFTYSLSGLASVDPASIVTGITFSNNAALNSPVGSGYVITPA